MNRSKIIKTNITPSLKWCFSIVFSLLMISSIIGQHTVKQQFFNYEANGRKYVGSFQYEFFVENGAEDHDLLANSSIDFTTFDKEIRIVISNLKFRPGTATGLEFRNEWQRYSRDKIKPTSSRTVKLSERSRPQMIKYKVVKDGSIKLMIGFSVTGALFGKKRPEYIKLGFRAKGVSNAKPEIQPTPIDVSKEREKQLWERIQARDSERDYKLFIEKFPNSEYVALAEEALKRKREETIPEPIPTPELKPEPKPEKPKELTEEEKAWQLAVQGGTILTYQYFIDTYPDHEYAENAKQAIADLHKEMPLEVNVHERNDRFIFLFHNAKNPEIVEVEPNEQLSLWVTEDSIEVLLVKDQVYTFTIKDDFGRTKVIEIDNSTPPLTGKVKAENGVLTYEGKGGMPPYFLEIRDDTDHIANRVNLVGNKGKLSFKKLGNSLSGVYVINLMDKRKSVSVTFENIVIKQQKYKVNIWLIIGIGGGVIGLFFLGRHFYKKLYGNEFEM